MNQFKRVIFLLCIFALFWHLLAIFVFVTDARYSPPLLNKIAVKYMIPYFNQRWKMFAPDPPLSEYRLFYRVQFTDGQWSSWRDPAYMLVYEFQKNRFSSSGPQYIVQDRVCRRLWDAYDRKKNEKDFPENLKETWQYQNAINYYRNRVSVDFPGHNVKMVQFAMLEQVFNPMSDRFEPKKMNVIFKFPASEI